ncbi:MAG: cell division protein FtsZ [Candidatus Bathyarchaeia archaeon]
MVLKGKALRYTRHEITEQGLIEPGRCRILIMGVGGGGNNTLNRVMTLGVAGAQCIAVNTDIQHLEMIHADKKILIGDKLTRGLGAGGKPYVGREAMLESRYKVESLVGETDVAFIAAGMGGGTGTGAAPIVADICRKKGAIVIGVVTIPFRHEKGRMNFAIQGLTEMRRAANTTVIIDNNKLMDLVPQLPINEAFTRADEILANMVKGIVETITLPSLINLDFADFRTIMEQGDIAIVGMGESDAPNRAEEAAKNAMSHLLLEVDYEGASGALIHISGGRDLTLGEAVRTAEIVTEMMDERALVIWGARVDPSLGDLLRVTLVLTGIRSPQILGGYRFPKMDLFNLEPNTGQEEPLKVELGLYQMESKKR